MVLDTIENEAFVFKNTYEEKKQVRIPMDHEDAPDEFFFVHINYTAKPQGLKSKFRRLFRF